MKIQYFSRCAVGCRCATEDGRTMGIQEGEQNTVLNLDLARCVVSQCALSHCVCVCDVCWSGRCAQPHKQQTKRTTCRAKAITGNSLACTVYCSNSIYFYNSLRTSCLSIQLFPHSPSNQSSLQQRGVSFISLVPAHY